MVIPFILFFLIENFSFLDSLYQAGDYAGVIKEGEAILTKELKKEDKVEILKIMAFASIALTQEERAEEYFLSLLKISPNFSLNPVTTSPKILRVFQKAKGDFAQLKREETNLSSPLIYFYPGLFQLRNQQRAKGYFLVSLTTVSAVGFLTSVILTPIFHRSYLEKRIPSEIESAYRLYKSSYIAQQVFGISFGFSYGLHILDLKISE